LMETEKMFVLELVTAEATWSSTLMVKLVVSVEPGVTRLFVGSQKR
jgi:hypothetical protein